MTDIFSWHDAGIAVSAIIGTRVYLAVKSAVSRHRAVRELRRQAVVTLRDVMRRQADDPRERGEHE